jgi:uncharacterized Zn finger protein
MGFWGYAPYVSVAQKKAKAAKKLAALKKKRNVSPVIIQGSTLARTWWGKAWNRNLERYADYSNRIERGRSYVRHGAVLDLRIDAGEIKALVQGSRAAPYAVAIGIKKLNRNTWKRITSECAGMLESLPELLSGNFPKPLGEIFMQQDAGLFPAPKEIAFECSCPDWAGMCKHVTATLYGVGARLDQDPALFFALRGVDTADLVSRTVAAKAGILLQKAERKSSRVIAESDLSRVFGIDLAGRAEVSAAGPGRRSRVGAGATVTGKAAVRKAVSSTPAPAGSKPGTAKNKKPAQGRKSKSALTKKRVAKKA